MRLRFTTLLGLAIVAAFPALWADTIQLHNVSASTALTDTDPAFAALSFEAASAPADGQVGPPDELAPEAVAAPDEAAAASSTASMAVAAQTLPIVGPVEDHGDGPGEPGELRTATIGGGARPLRIVFAPIWPTKGQITTYFGELGPTSPRGHAGLDIAGPWGEAVQAADEGEVLKAYWNDEGYGGLVVIAHASGYETWYGHLSRFGVEVGQHVRRGEAIGRLGSTGYSTGPHLHFEVRQDGALCDPLAYLAEKSLQDADW